MYYNKKLVIRVVLTHTIYWRSNKRNVNSTISEPKAWNQVIFIERRQGLPDDWYGLLIWIGTIPNVMQTSSIKWLRTCLPNQRNLVRTISMKKSPPAPRWMCHHTCPVVAFCKINTDNKIGRLKTGMCECCSYLQKLKYFTLIRG